MPHDHHQHAHEAGHDHGHDHAPQDFGRAFAIGIALNLLFVAVLLWTALQMLLKAVG